MPFESRADFLESMSRDHGRQLRRFLAGRLRNANADASDLMQEVFLRLLRIDDYETIRNPQAYLHTIASHVLQQHALKQQGSRVSIGEIDCDLTPGNEDPAVEIETEQAFSEIERRLKAYSPRAYTTLVMSRCHGITLEEIAKQLGVSRGQVKKYLAKALILVREHLRQMGEELP